MLRNNINLIFFTSDSNFFFQTALISDFWWSIHLPLIISIDQFVGIGIAVMKGQLQRSAASVASIKIYLITISKSESINSEW